MKDGIARIRDAVSRWVSRIPVVPPESRDRVTRAVFILLVILPVLLPLSAFLLWRSLSDQPEVVAYSRVAEALEAGFVERVNVESGQSRLTVVYRADGRAGEWAGEEVTANVPLGSLELSDLERWRVAGAEVNVESPSGGPGILAPIVILLFVGLAVTLVLRAQRAPSRRFGTTPLDRQLTLADVGGAREATEELRDVIEYLRAPWRFEALGAACPKGVLLVGPPGTGKTLLARAVAGESGVPVIVASGSEFAEMYVGVGARRVRDLARQARKLAPCIVFIDEFDSVGGRRGRPNRTGEEETTLNQLLVEMDGLSANSGVVWMAATNRDDMLDSAVKRPGRFDRVVEVSLPSSSDRLDILRVHGGRRPLAADVDLERLAAVTVGYSGADLANLLNEAAIIAVQERATTISNRQIELARDKVMLGRIRSGVVISDEERRLIALHEAGHAVVGLVACPQDRLHKVTIEPRGRSLGAAHFAPDVDRHLHSRRYLEGIIAKALGGRAAETVFLGPDAVTSGAGSDLIHATGIARRMVAEFGMSPEVGLVSADSAAQGGPPSGHLQTRIDRAVRALLESQARRAEEIVATHRDAVDALANALQERVVLSAQDVEAIVRAHGVPVVHSFSAEPLDPARDVGHPTR